MAGRVGSESVKEPKCFAEVSRLESLSDGLEETAALKIVRSPETSRGLKFEGSQVAYEPIAESMGLG